MALANDDLLAISNLLDAKLKPVELLLENDVLPRLQHIEACYTSTYRRYANGVNDIEQLKTDMDIVKKVVAGHREKLKKIS